MKNQKFALFFVFFFGLIISISASTTQTETKTETTSTTTTTPQSETMATPQAGVDAQEANTVKSSSSESSVASAVVVSSTSSTITSSSSSSTHSGSSSSKSSSSASKSESSESSNLKSKPKVNEKVKTADVKTSAPAGKKPSKIDKNLVEEYVTSAFFDYTQSIVEADNVPSTNQRFKSIRGLLKNFFSPIQAVIVLACNKNDNCDKAILHEHLTLALNKNAAAVSQLIETHNYKLRNSIHCVIASAVNDQKKLTGSYNFENFLKKNSEYAVAVVKFVKVLCDILAQRIVMLIDSDLSKVQKNDIFLLSEAQAKAMKNAFVEFHKAGKLYLEIYTAINTDIFEPFKNSEVCMLDYCSLIPTEIFTKYKDNIKTYFKAPLPVSSDIDDATKKAFYLALLPLSDNILSFNKLTQDTRKAQYAKCKFTNAEEIKILEEMNEKYFEDLKKAFNYVAPQTEVSSKSSASSKSSIKPLIAFPLPLATGINEVCIDRLNENCKGHYLFEKFISYYKKELAPIDNECLKSNGDLNKCIAYLFTEFFGGNGFKIDVSNIATFFEKAKYQDISVQNSLRMLEESVYITSDVSVEAMINSIEIPKYNVEEIKIDGNTLTVKANFTELQAEMTETAVKEGSSSYMASAFLLLAALCFIF